MQVNVYVLGAVYLQLIRLLRLEDSHTLAKPVDPSLYLTRFTEKMDFPQGKVRGNSRAAVSCLDHGMGWG